MNLKTSQSAMVRGLGEPLLLFPYRCIVEVLRAISAHIVTLEALRRSDALELTRERCYQSECLYSCPSPDGELSSLPERWAQYTLDNVLQPGLASLGHRHPCPI